MNEIYDKLDALYLLPAAENRRPMHYERVRKLSEIELIMERVRLVSHVNKRKGGSELAVPFVVDIEGHA